MDEANIWWEQADDDGDLEDLEFSLSDALEELAETCKTLHIPVPSWVKRAEETLNEIQAAIKHLPPADDDWEDDDEDLEDDDDFTEEDFEDHDDTELEAERQAKLLRIRYGKIPEKIADWWKQ